MTFKLFKAKKISKTKGCREEFLEPTDKMVAEFKLSV